MASLEYPDENTTQAIDKLAKTARILSAVTLLSGLSDGSIPVDNAISELMNLGSIDLKSLENFDKTKVDKFIDKLKSVNLRDESKYVEESVRNLYTIQEKWKTVGNLTGLPDGNTYKKLYALNNIDVSSLKNLPFDNVLDLLAKPSLSEADVGSLKTSLTDISTKIGSTKTSISLEEMVKILESLKPLYIISEVFSLLGASSPPILGLHNADSFFTNFKFLDGLTSDADSALFDTLGKVISYRFVFHPTNRDYSSGFLNGFNDLNKLEEDSKDEWVQKLFGSFVRLDEVTSLVKLQTPMMEMDKKWSTHATPDVYNSIRRVMNIRQSLVGVTKKESKKDIEDILGTADNCWAFRSDRLANEAIKKFVKGTAELSRKVPAFLQIHKSNAQLKAEVIDKLSTSIKSGDLKEIRSAIIRLQSDIKSVLDGRSFKDIKMDIPYVPVITKFSTLDFTQDHKKAFDCLLKLKSGFKNIALSAKAILEIRDLKANLKSFDDLKSSSIVISESSSSLKSIRQLFGTIKAKNSTDTIKKLAKYSKPFGEAVNALVSADVALSKTKEFQSLIAQGRLIETTVEALDEIVLDKNFWKEWGDFGETVHQILSLTSKVSEWENEIEVFNGTSFDELAAVFPKFPELNDVEIDFMDRLSSLKLVNPVWTPNINELRDDFIKSLKPVLKLDLQFSRFKSAVAGMPETMKQVSRVLKGENEDLVVYPPPVKPDKPVDTERILFTIIIVMMVSCFFTT
ncbi:hypothetical protein CAEBREN_24435 [Caenorhabditis brenneri]|uniref:Domain of unknown function WSN domain-containing protein n=1 Tax=Caenorhabditis brenneri TaxID=135651 RepID=G0N846_CAEBE|nr:hypothetical protein CAEBREN_24435 [Caenorhabditis brenneri]